MLKRWMPTFEMLGIPNAFQFAYKNDKSSLVASFVLQEMINHNVERGSKVYCCFLYSTKAFDTVWLDGLFFKFYNVGMKGKCWRFGNIKWYVSLNGKKSVYFPVKQGVRQGGVLAPWLYLCYNNDIPKILGATSYGVTVNSNNRKFGLGCW